MFSQVVELTPQRVMQISRLSLEDLNRSNIQIEAFIEAHTREMVVRMERHMYGVKLEDFTVKHPTNWLEAIKERWFPQWLLRRYPVRYQHHQIQQHAVFPDWVFEMRDQLGPVSLMINKPLTGEFGLFNWGE